MLVINALIICGMTLIDIRKRCRRFFNRRKYKRMMKERRKSVKLKNTPMLLSQDSTTVAKPVEKLERLNLDIVPEVEEENYSFRNSDEDEETKKK